MPEVCRILQDWSSAPSSWTGDEYPRRRLTVKGIFHLSSSASPSPRVGNYLYYFSTNLEKKFSQHLEEGMLLGKPEMTNFWLLTISTILCTSNLAMWRLVFHDLRQLPVAHLWHVLGWFIDYHLPLLLWQIASLLFKFTTHIHSPKTELYSLAALRMANLQVVTEQKVV